MERFSNEKIIDKKFTKAQIDWIMRLALCELEGTKKSSIKEEITIENYRLFEEESFQDLSHHDYMIVTSILDILKG